MRVKLVMTMEMSPRPKFIQIFSEIVFIHTVKHPEYKAFSAEWAKQTEMTMNRSNSEK